MARDCRHSRLAAVKNSSDRTTNAARQPSAWVAAGSSFAAFTVGAVLPVLPYLLGATGLGLTVAIGALGLFGAGALVSRFTARSWWYSGARQLLLGALAAGVTFAIGSAFGAA